MRFRRRRQKVCKKINVPLGSESSPCYSMMCASTPNLQFTIYNKIHHSESPHPVCQKKKMIKIARFCKSHNRKNSQEQRYRNQPQEQHQHKQHPSSNTTTKEQLTLDLVWSTLSSTPGVSESLPMNTRLSRPRFSLNLAPTPTMVLSTRSQDPRFQILLRQQQPQQRQQ